MASRADTVPSAVFNSSSRSSGHSPMNLVVMCKFEGAHQLIRAVGRSSSSSRSSLPTTSGGTSRPMNNRMSASIVQWTRMRFGPILDRAFYERPTVEVARELLGKVLVHGPAAGIIVETEAYLGGDDLASHSAAGITDRTRVIFGPPGHAYVYFIYGMSECLNLVVDLPGQAGCGLIR